MGMVRILLSSVLSVCVALSLFAVSAPAAEKELKLASWGPAKHFIATQRATWIKEVNAAAKGRYKIVEYPGGQLYGPKEMHKATAKGLTDFGVILLPRMLAMVPMLEGVYLPFSADNMKDVEKGYTGESLKIIDKALMKKRMKLVYVAFADGVHIFSNKGSINTLEDLKGLRVLSTSPMVTKIFSMLGASPDTSIPLTEQYMALKRNVADASLDSTVNGYFQKKHEVSKYLTKVNMSWAPILVCMNLRKWNKLPADIQEAMLKYGQKARMTSIPYALGWEKKFTGVLQKSGAVVTALPDAERKKIQKIARKEWKAWADRVGGDAHRLLELNAKK